MRLAITHKTTLGGCKNQTSIWTDTQQRASDNFKAALTSDSVLAHPRFDQQFILSTVASDYAISAILNKLRNRKEIPISFASRMLNAAERNYSTTQKDLLAVEFGTQTHRCFLCGRKFKIITDHAALKWLITAKNHQCARLTRRVLKLTEYEFEIEHKEGKKHVNADTLSRHIVSVVTETGNRNPPCDDSGQVLTRETVLVEHPYCKKLMGKLETGTELKFLISDDGLSYEGPDLKNARLAVPAKMTRSIMEMHHDMVFAGC
jgi:hypothetical protein